MSLQGRNSAMQEPRDGGPARGFVSGATAAFDANPRLRSLAALSPRRGTVLLVLLGMMAGMLTAYVIIPTEFTGASPRHMSQQAIEQWVRMVAVGHSDAIQYDDANALLVLQQIPNPQGTVAGLAGNAQIPAAERAALEALMEIDGFEALAGPLAPQDPGPVGSSLQVIAALLVVGVAVPVLTIAARALYPARDHERASTRAEARRAGTDQAQTTRSASRSSQAHAAQAEAPVAMNDETERGATTHPQHGAPVLHAVSTYIKGRNYDDSFAIELGPDQDNRFLGECGLSAATQVGNELQSVEFWGFDIASQETVTKVFAAPAALHDPALAATVGNRVQDPLNDIVAAEHGARLILESNSILIQAEIKAVVCNYGGGMPNSGIENLQIEVIAWQRQSQRSTLPASNYPTPADSPFAEYADAPFAAPGAGGATPAPPPAVNAGSAPSKRPEDEEDDPFGGTGNFMPYS